MAWVFPVHTDLTSAVKRFFEILDQRESSDSGVDFNPVQMDYKALQISSCRVLLTAELSNLLPQMRQLTTRMSDEELEQAMITSGGA